MRYPSAMEEYLSEYGFNLNKRLYHFAVSLMRNHKGERMQPWDLDRVDEFLKNNGVTVENNVGYNTAYAISMGMADYLGSSIPDDRHLAMFVKDYLDDPDGAKTKAFDHFYIDCVAKGIAIFWDDML